MSPHILARSAVAARAIDHSSIEPSLVVRALRHAASHPDRLAVVDRASNERLARGELAARSAALAAGLSERRIGRGDLVAVAMPSSAWWPVVALGVWRAGAALARVSPLWTALETGRVLADFCPRIAVAFGELVPVMRGALSAARLPISVLVHDVGPETPCTPLARLFASTDVDLFAEPELQPSDLAALLLSSGSGGLSKGVLLTHDDLTTAAPRWAFTPFLHSLGLIRSLCVAMYTGAPMVIFPTPDVEAVPAELA